MNRKTDVICAASGKATSTDGFRITVDVTKDFDSKVTLIASTRVANNEDPDEILEKNKDKLMYEPRWRVNQIDPMDRACIQNFKSVPYDILSKYWRKPVDLRASRLRPVGGSLFRFINENYFFKDRRITCWLNWPEINSDLYVMTNGELPEEIRIIMQWMLKNSPEVCLFTDSTSVFPDPQMEFSYISDLMR